MGESLQEIELLLVESGGWFVGVDATTVRRVADASLSTARPVELAELMGGRLSPATSAKPRCLVVQVEAEERWVEVDRTLDAVVLSANQLQAVPPTLRYIGAPAWWLGTTWFNDRLVLLVDLAQALRARAESAAA